MNTIDRNQQAQQYIIHKLDKVSQLNENQFHQLTNFKQLKQILDNLIPVKAMGFRGIVATALTGRHLDPNYDPLNHFYKCNPRAIFEQGIFYAFRNKIPCGKSDPLNVAKNTNVLDEEWARGKRPQSAAQAVVNYLRFLRDANNHEKETIIDYFFFKLLKYANNISNFQITIPQQMEVANQTFANQILNFILQYPESGTTPQFIISTLMKTLYHHSTIKVLGGDESVFGTNTTSKKPADIWLEQSNIPYNLFEITVKKIDYKRLDDCIDSLNSINMLDRQITFICRIPEDISDLKYASLGTLNHRGKIFNFVDIRNFVLSIIALLAEHQIQQVINEITQFINRIDRPVSTKNGWNEIF